MHLMILQMSGPKRPGSREEGQAHSSNAARPKQVHSLAGTPNSPADPKPASSQVKAEAQPPDGISSPSTDQKPGSDTAAPIKVQLVNGNGQVPAGDGTASVQVKIQTQDTKGDARPEPGEISNTAACEGGKKGDDVDLSNGTGLTVKLAVRVKGDEAVAGSPVAKPQELKPRDRYVVWCVKTVVTNHADLLSCSPGGAPAVTRPDSFKVARQYCNPPLRMSDT